jgi:hypothetical protein
MLVPLDTLSGWPQVQNPTVLQSLLLLVGFPVLVFLIVIAINKITQSIHAARGHDVQGSDPLWVGDHGSAELESASANPGTEAGEQTETGEADIEGDDAGEHVGGAGARW